MKRSIAFLALTALLTNGSLEAQEKTGAAAASSSLAAKSNNWQNWIFAATAIVTATVGILIVTVDDGNQPSSQAH